MNTRNRFSITLVSLLLLGCSISSDRMNRALQFYTGPRLSLDQISILLHESCLNQKTVLTHVDGKKISTCNPIALPIGNHVIEMIYSYEVTRAPFESRCADPSKKPWECLGEITYVEGRSHHPIVPCQMEPGQMYKIISNLAETTTTGYCIPTSDEGVKRQYPSD